MATKTVVNRVAEAAGEMKFTTEPEARGQFLVWKSFLVNQLNAS